MTGKSESPTVIETLSLSSLMHPEFVPDVTPPDCLAEAASKEIEQNQTTIFSQNQKCNEEIRFSRSLLAFIPRGESLCSGMLRGEDGGC